MQTDGHRACVISSPVSGEVIPIAEVADPMFAAEVMGPSAAIEPISGVLRAPADGIITLVSRSVHAFTMTSDSGAELLIHAGIDTVSLKGGPFIPHMAVGDRVREGDALLDIDADAIREAGYHPTVIVIVTNADAWGSVETAAPGPIEAGTELMRLR